MAYRWFCKLELEDKVPDHSYLSKTRNRFGERIFEALFTTILNLCRKHGLLGSNIMMTDSTLIKANASLNSLTPIEAKAAVDEKAARKAAINKLGPPVSRSISNSTHISKTDKDVSLAQKEGSPRELKYKVHNSIDATSRVIIDTKVTTGKTHECGVYGVYIERIKYIIQKHKLNIKEVVADRGYGSREIIETLQKEVIVSYIPLFSTKSGRTIQEAYSAGFVYQKEQDRFIYPEDQYLNPYGFLNGESKYYRSKSSICAICKQKDACIASAKKSRPFTKYLIRSIHQELFDKTFEAMQESALIGKLKERMWKIEGIFAEAKQLHGLGKARYRRLERVQIQAYMVAVVQNIKRIIKQLFYVFLYFLNMLNKIFLTYTFSTAPVFLHTSKYIRPAAKQLP
ncbi:transposase [Candidatus Amoebophilus asiaticus 5a2]|uniref:Transposase n=1 Tax=Amoebophilus asiaticus (strain 5a2) TaxID=452471 RepID=C3L446_AMOA5|nr:transposase [Candidatus Amoebophilus asiaticus 5a2]